MKITLYAPVSLNERGQRIKNEDCIYPSYMPVVDTANQVFIVCDGVGGTAKGEVASLITCNTLGKYLVNRTNITEKDIKVALQNTENKISTYVKNNPESDGMATTLTLFVAYDKGVLLAHIGDSRIYHIRDGSVLYKTTDHSLVNEWVKANIITETAALTHPKRNVITRVVGRNDPQADIQSIRDIQAEDYFFLCTDGILEGINEKELLKLLSREDVDNKEKMRQVKAACHLYSKDNYSAYLLQVKNALES